METRDAKKAGTHDPRTPIGPKEALAVRRVVWISFVIALVAYGFVGAFVFAADARPVDLPAWLWPVVAAVLGMGSLLVSGVLRGRNPAPSPMASGRTVPTTPVTGALSVPELLGWGMAEGIGIIGLVTVVFGGSVRGLVVYQVAALILLVLERPSE
jgi:hypothetical protein